MKKYALPFLVLISLAIAGCGRNHMNRPFSKKSEKAFQESYARFEKEASDEERAIVLAGVTSITTISIYGRALPPAMLRKLTDGLPPIQPTIWQTLGGHSPNEIIEWGAAVQQRMSSLSPR